MIALPPLDIPIMLALDVTVCGELESVPGRITWNFNFSNLKTTIKIFLNIRRIRKLVYSWTTSQYHVYQNIQFLLTFKTAQLKKNFNALATNNSLFLLYMIIMFKYDGAILKIIYNMASLKNYLTLKVNGSMILPLA